jgi:hypothetical protein
MMPSPRLRWSVWRMIVAGGMAALFVACLVGFLPSVGWLPTSIDPAPPPLRANTDHDLFDIVLTDLIQEFRQAGGGAGPRPFQILIGDRTPGAIRELEKALGEHSKELPEEIRADLVHRNPERTPYSLSRYQPSNPDILVHDLRPVDTMLGFDRQFPNAVGFVVPFLPGYSADGRTALFYFYYGPNMHGASGYYLLRKVKGRWEINLKGFYRFPHEDGLVL